MTERQYIEADGQQWPVSTDQELRQALRVCAEGDMKWTNKGVSSVCLWAWRKILALEAELHLQNGRVGHGRYEVD